MEIEDGAALARAFVVGEEAMARGLRFGVRAIRDSGSSDHRRPGARVVQRLGEGLVGTRRGVLSGIGCAA